MTLVSASVAVACAKRILDWHFQWFSRLLWDHLAVDEWILDARIVLDQPVFPQFEIEVLELVKRERMVVTPVKVTDLSGLLGYLCCWARAWICIRGLQAKFRGMHVVLLSAFHGSSVEGASPPKEHTKDNVTSVVNIEYVLSCHEMLRPKKLPKRSPSV